MKSNAQLARETLTAVTQLGVRKFVICSGARNAPLLVPLLKNAGRFRIFRHFDERAAAFFALGLAKRNLEPVCVLTTSGTAVAELLPATIEAHYSGLPLILLTADRPERFRGTGAPQAIEQETIFGNYTSRELETWTGQTPLHLNLCLEEPLFDGDFDFDLKPAVESTIELPVAGETDALDPGKKTVVLLGELHETERSAVCDFLEETGLPTWSEATSGLREADGLNHIRGGDASFQNAEVEQVLRIGGVPSLRFWRDLETRPEIAVHSISRAGFSGLARANTNQQGAFGEQTVLLRNGETIQQGTFDELLPRSRDPANAGLLDRSEEENAISNLSKSIPPEAMIFLGNSLPIREWNLAATTEIAHPNGFANRGANGIDGEVSTFLGLCDSFDEGWGIFGDLTALYDLNAPWVLDQIGEGKRIRIVVINNGGGRIFSKLPGMKDLSETEKHVTENRHAMDFQKWAEMWGLEYATSADAVKTDRAVIEKQVQG
ncbi:MAG: hypothetical protein HKN23_11010 [Verrucomicrobiales bacterium]|nr:hypothetical protein [Verrucomicrobiales bacterium]